MATVFAPRPDEEDAPRLSLVLPADAPASLPASQDIDSTLHENRVFAPPAGFSAMAHIGSMEEYEALYRQSIADPEAFWADAATNLHWFKRWDNVLEWNLPWAKWFVGGKLNLSYNCVDRHALGKHGQKTALIWEGEPSGEQRRLTYAELHVEVQRFANALKNLGIQKGDRVAIYMGMTPELAIALLACARIGAIHSVIFGGFAANAIVDRVNDSGCVAILTQDSSYRRGNEIQLKQIVDEAVLKCPTVRHVVVLRRSGAPVTMVEGRDHWWHELTAATSPICPPEEMDSEDPLFILYTSGTTGKPKGLVHTTGGYAVQTYLTTKYIFDLKEEDIYWCMADIGWITGHSYVVYGPLANGATVLLFEGAPAWPVFSRCWQIVEEHKVTVLYTAPTAIRAFIKWGDEFVEKNSQDSLRLLGSVGEPINPEVWMWYREKVGHARCPIVDTWWQTETGAILISPLPGATPTKPGSATLPFFGIQPEVVNKEGKPVPPGHGGFLVVRKPWPAMARTIYGDPERFHQTYWSQVKGSYFTGDGARVDEDGYFWLMGRVDDVINVSGHRLGTMEVESALVSHPMVAEAAVVGRPDELKGQSIAAFVVLEHPNKPTLALKEELRKWVAKEIGALARPDVIRFTEILPKTRSGKIMRRLLRELASSGEVKGDITTLEDFSAIALLREVEEV
jgi:acetyl-CoA synthetase